MSKDPTTGLFSKVARLVRSPSSRWGEPSGMGEAEDSGQGKQLLKEMIERKRRNDFVRKREFAELRRLRQREALSGRMLDTQGRPSFFQTSLATRPDDRAVTLRKIDEIEAQMSMQWWRGRDPEPGAEATGANDSANPISAFAVEPESHTQPLNLATGATTPESLERAFAPTQTGPSTMIGEGVTERGLARFFISFMGGAPGVGRRSGGAGVAGVNVAEGIKAVVVVHGHGDVIHIQWVLHRGG